jgi:hypothetical protein
MRSRAFANRAFQSRGDYALAPSACLHFATTGVAARYALQIVMYLTLRAAAAATLCQRARG